MDCIHASADFQYFPISLWLKSCHSPVGTVSAHLCVYNLELLAWWTVPEERHSHMRQKPLVPANKGVTCEKCTKKRRHHNQWSTVPVILGSQVIMWPICQSNTTGDSLVSFYWAAAGRPVPDLHHRPALACCWQGCTNTVVQLHEAVHRSADCPSDFTLSLQPNHKVKTNRSPASHWLVLMWFYTCMCFYTGGPYTGGSIQAERFTMRGTDKVMDGIKIY